VLSCSLFLIGWPEEELHLKTVNLLLLSIENLVGLYCLCRVSKEKQDYQGQQEKQACQDFQESM